MQDTPKIIKAQAHSNRMIDVHFNDGVQASFNFENLYDYVGYYSFLKDLNSFIKISIESNGDHVFWVNPEGEEIEVDSAHPCSICSQQKIIVNNETVFDPSLGKNGWL